MPEHFEVLAQRAITYHQRAAALSQRYPLGHNPFVDSTRACYDKAIADAQRAQIPQHLDVLAANIAKMCRKTDDCAVWLVKISNAAQAIIAAKAIEAQEAYRMLSTFSDEQAKRRQRNLRMTAALMILAFATIFVIAFQQIRVRSLNRELQAQLKMLQARLNPHFIANCMNAIDALIGQNRLKEASNYIIRFTRLCRNLLDNSDKTTIAVGKELETLTYYLDLEKLRLGDQLNYRITIDHTIDQQTTRIPLMMLQPFVENAIWHGIQPKPGPGTVHVEIRRAPGQRLCLTVEDDGIGRRRSKDVQSRSNREHRSWGMDISRQRIEAIRRMRGAAFEITDMHAPTGEPTGTRVTIHLPEQTLEAWKT